MPKSRPEHEESELLPEQPPLLSPGALGEEEETDEGNGADLLDLLDEDPDLDDSNASDLESGIALDETDVVEAGGDEQLAVDVGELLDARETAPHLDDEAEDAVATDDLFGEKTLGNFSAEDLDDTTSDEGFDDLIEESLPGLDADDGEDPTAGDALFDTTVLSGEELPPRAELMWGEIPLSTTEPSRSVVRAFEGGAIVFGNDVTIVEESGARRLITGVPGLVQSAVIEPSASVLLYTTSGGALFRVALPEGSPEPLVAYREALTVSGQSPELTLGGPTPSVRPALLLHVGGATRALLESTDHGKTWRRVELRGSVLALSVGSPPACLVVTERGTKLMRSESSGGFAAVGPAWTADAEVPTLATAGDVVVVMEPGAPLRVSADGGATFRSATNTRQATAIAAGRLGGRPRAFAALFDPTSGRTALVSVDPTTADAFVIGFLESDGDEDEEDRCRVRSLAWDENEETLHATGDFGLARFRRPPSA